jgi:hypothetical protein
MKREYGSMCRSGKREKLTREDETAIGKRMKYRKPLSALQSIQTPKTA